MVDTRLDTYAEVCKNSYDQLREVQVNEFKEVVNYLEEQGYLTEEDDKPETYLEAVQVIENFYVDEFKDREKADARVDYLENRIKELEQMYDDMVAKKAKPATPRWITEIGSVFKSIFKNNQNNDREGRFHKAYKIGDCLIACDGYRILRTAEPVEDIEIGDNAAWSVQMNDMMKCADLEFKSYELPPLSVLKEFESKAKANKPKGGKLIYAFKTDKGMVGYNFKYLTDGMKATHSNLIRVSGLKTPATMQDSEKMLTTYLLLPINMQNSPITEDGVYWV